MAKILTLNYHKMAKNGPNDPIFGPVMYYNGLDQIPKNFRKRAKIGHFLAEKPIFFAFFKFFFRNSILNGKFIEIHPDAPISPIFGLKWSLECQARKGDGAPRRTVDMSALNKACLRETHHVKPPSQQARSIPRNTWKSVTDAWNGFHSVRLAEEDHIYHPLGEIPV